MIKGLNHHYHGKLLKVCIALTEGQYNLEAMYYVKNAKYYVKNAKISKSFSLQLRLTAHISPPRCYPYLPERLYLYILTVDLNNYKFQNPEVEITTLEIQSRIWFQNFLNLLLTLYWTDYNLFSEISSPHTIQITKSI